MFWSILLLLEAAVAEGMVREQVVLEGIVLRGTLKLVAVVAQAKLV